MENIHTEVIATNSGQKLLLGFGFVFIVCTSSYLDVDMSNGLSDIIESGSIYYLYEKIVKLVFAPVAMLISIIVPLRNWMVGGLSIIVQGENLVFPLTNLKIPLKSIRSVDLAGPNLGSIKICQSGGKTNRVGVSACNQTPTLIAEKIRLAAGLS